MSYKQPTIIVNKYTADDTWTKNVNTRWVEYYVWSGGGGGGGGSKGINNSGGGGGGGVSNFLAGFADASLFASSETITVGAGGTGGGTQTTDSSVGNPGNNGGDSSIGSKIVANGTGTAGLGGRITAAAVTPATGSSCGLGGFVSIVGSAAALPSGTATNPTALFLCGAASGGGAGGNYTTGFGAPSPGRAGASISIGSTVLLAGGTAGAVAAANGNNGNDASTLSPAAYITGGTGGGGGACSGSVAGATSGGNGGDGGIPGGGGGGGGGCLNSGGTGVGGGAGGDGARGEVWIIEYL